MKNLLLLLFVFFMLGIVYNSNAQITEYIPSKYKENKQTQQTPKGLKQRKANGEKANTLWTGAISSDWNNSGNWSTGNVPTSNDNVSIPTGTPYSPVIGSGVHAYCDNLYLYTNVILTQNAGSYFYCYGTFDAGYGQFTMNGSSILFFRGSGNNLWYDDNQNDTYSYIRLWKASPTATITMQNNMTCSGNFEIREGTFEMEEGLRLTVTNSGTNAFEVEDGGILNLDGSDRHLRIAGTLAFRDGSQLSTESSILTFISVGGDLLIENNILYDIIFSICILTMDGSGDQFIRDHDDGNLYIYSFAVTKPSGTCYLANADLHTNTIAIQSGEFSCRSDVGSPTIFNIYCRRWENGVGESAFDEATGRVIFEESGAINDSEVFYELEVNSLDPVIITIGSNVSCSAYKWTNGGIEVFNGSIFTANDLLDNAVQGEYILHDGGTINLTNSGLGSEYVDLKGDLHIYGGTMNVTGSLSYWPYQEDASIEMSDGILDFNCDGIRIDDNGFALNDNITGGIIRTSGYFQGNRADFTPTDGIFELYGSSDVIISQSNGSALYWLEINKASKDGSNPAKEIPIKDERSGEIISTGSKSNSVTLGSDFANIFTLIVREGSLILDGYELSVDFDSYIYGTLNMTNPMDVFNAGDGMGDHLYFLDGSTANIQEGQINFHNFLVIFSGTSFTASTSSMLNFETSSPYGGIMNEDPNTIFGNINVNMPTGIWKADVLSTEPIVVNGDFTIFPGSTVELNNETLIVHGNFTDDVTSEIYVYNVPGTDKSLKDASFTEQQKELTVKGAKAGYLEIDTDFSLNGLLDVGDGNVLLHGIIEIASSGSLLINGGSVVCDMPFVSGSSWQHFDGNLEISDGFLEISENSLLFASTTTTNISGGTIRVGTAFSTSSTPGVFVPSGGIVEKIGPGNINCFPGNSFYNLKINHTWAWGYTTYTTDTEVQNNLEIINSNFRCSPPASPSLYIGGNWTNSSGFFDPGEGTVHFTGGSKADILTDETFYNLSVEKTVGSFDALEITTDNTVNVLNNLNVVDGTLELNSNSTLNIGNNINILFEAGLNAGGADIDINLSLGGDWNNYNTEYNTIFGYTPGGETITFLGTTDQEISTSASKEDFGNLVINKTSGQFRPNNSINVKGDLLIADGQWNDNISSLTHYFEGDIEVDASGGFYTASNLNTVVFKTTSDQYITYNGTAGYFCNIIVDKTNWPAKKAEEGGELIPDKNIKQSKNPKASTVICNTDIIMQNGDLIIDEGIMDLNGEQLFAWDNIDIIDGGNLIMNDGEIRMWDGGQINVNDGGILTAIGTSSKNAKITRRSTGYYDFNVNTGGTLSAEHATFEYMNWYGVYVTPTGIVDPAHAFNYCTFQNVYATSGASSLTLDNDQILSCNGAHFPDNPYYNIYKTPTSVGEITFIGATGDFASPEFEFDLNDKIHWSGMDVELDLNAILEGPYNGTNMNTVLNTLGLIPLNQPFDSKASADWYYEGIESVASIPPNVVDWVLVQLRDADDPATADAGSIVAKQAAFLLNDGSVVDLDGISNLTILAISYDEGLFPVIYQRNHLGVLSSDMMSRSGGVYTWDFSVAGSAYSNTNPGEKHLSGEIYGMYSGDVSGGGKVNITDFDWWDNFAGESGYLFGDLNLDGQSDNIDKNDYIFINLNTNSQIPGSKNE